MTSLSPPHLRQRRPAGRPFRPCRVRQSVHRQPRQRPGAGRRGRRRRPPRRLRPTDRPGTRGAAPPGAVWAPSSGARRASARATSWPGWGAGPRPRDSPLRLPAQPPGQPRRSAALAPPRRRRHPHPRPGRHASHGTPLYRLAASFAHEAFGYDPAVRPTWARIERAWSRLVDREGAGRAVLVDRAAYAVLFRFFHSAYVAADGAR